MYSVNLQVSQLSGLHLRSADTRRSSQVKRPLSVY